MSDVIGGLRINGEILVAIDFDRPIWQNNQNRKLSGTPTLKHFTVDGILLALSPEKLRSIGIEKRPDSVLIDSPELGLLRNQIYTSTNLNIEYFDIEHRENEISADLGNFKGKIVKHTISENEFFEIIND